MKTIDYYNQNADQFVASTFHVAMGELYQPFINHLSDCAIILDLGCGTGRDSLAFKKLGYQVEAIDFSEELVAKAKGLTGINVRQQSFYELDEQDKYHGIWACASLLHCDRENLADVMLRILNALKVNGILYMSFKYGESDREKDGRAFTDLNEQQAQDLLNQLEGFQPLKQWITVDQRPDREEEWLNLLWKKHA
ncbi:class I SAM-dependent methyltransferase [Acinetobacter kyonggiensis]|uniref:Methyltransferase domain-containing protein n=1 Tax=Acinetobacter kyonggiensis TaxID=595670 RepID=A0A1H3JFY7_9GAMM|nr:class I SAM-dependent methyltransferase [Acinetobacter kyonggiensis]SDY38893.1 Methyltransferase domain-containing protein [Acinetobacter kyonggiensis]